MKKLIISFSLIIGLCVALFAQVHRPQGNQKSPVSRNTYGNIIKSEVVSQTAQKDIDILQFIRTKIYDYYDRTSFEEPEWQRVKKFLIFLDKNGTRLNSLFNQKYKQYFYTLSNGQKEQLMAAFWGANYLTNTFINEDFEQKISLSNACEAYPQGGSMCITGDDILEVLDSAIHEATHLLFFVKNKGVTTALLLSEQATIFAQLYLSLPLKPDVEEIRLGTRTWFRRNQEENFIERYYDNILSEYVEAIFPITKYDKYKRDIKRCFGWKRNNSMSMTKAIYLYITVKIFNKWAIDKDYYPLKLDNFLDNQLVGNTTFNDISNEVLNKFYNDENIEVNTHEELVKNIENWYTSNSVAVATIIFQELAKSASPDIPPVPKGYI